MVFESDLTFLMTIFLVFSTKNEPDNMTQVQQNVGSVTY